MKDKLILEIFVSIDFKDISQFEGPVGSVVMIPFTGNASGDIFKGTILPGGVDTQIVNMNGVRHMCAKYMLEGTDNTGAKCKIYIENNGYFQKESPMPFMTIPTFLTDSKALAPYLHCNKFRGEGNMTGNNLTIKMFEIISE
jgi:hypothetical protein